jgi:hypothetical protein
MVVREGSGEEVMMVMIGRSFMMEGMGSSGEPPLSIVRQRSFMTRRQKRMG